MILGSNVYIYNSTYIYRCKIFELPQVLGTPCLDDGLGGKITTVNINIPGFCCSSGGSCKSCTFFSWITHQRHLPTPPPSLIPGSGPGSLSPFPVHPVATADLRASSPKLRVTNSFTDSSFSGMGSCTKTAVVASEIRPSPQQECSSKHPSIYKKWELQLNPSD